MTTRWSKNQWRTGAASAALALACDPLAPPPQDNGGDIDLPPSHGGAAGAFEPGPANRQDLQEMAASACVTFIEEPTLPPLALQLVVDVSGSMSFTPAGATESKWVLTRDALTRAVDDLPETVSLGAVFFPNKATEPNCHPDFDLCVPGEAREIDTCLNTESMLPISPLGAEGSMHRQALADAMTRVNPAGGTPTHDALNAALADLFADPGDTARFLLLLTDGQPTYLENCRGSGNIDFPVSEEPIIEAIDAAAADGIRTFVVGAPGSEHTAGDSGDARSWLSRAAQAGDTAPDDCSTSGPDYCHVDLSQEDEDFGPALVETLGQIMARTRPCGFEIPNPPGAQPLDFDSINVVLRSSHDVGFVLGKGQEDCQEGWRFESEEEEAVSLCPASCERYRADPNVTIELFFGCESAPAPRPT